MISIYENYWILAKPSYTHSVRNSRKLPVPAEPITPKPVSQSSLAGGRSTIHGRKTMSIREQQEKISKKNIAELVIRLKAENEIEVFLDLIIVYISLFSEEISKAYQPFS